MDIYLTAPQVADLLQCHDQTVYRNEWLPRVVIPGIGIRYRLSDLEKYIATKAVPCAPNLMYPSDKASFKLLQPSELGTIISGGLSEMPKGKTRTRINFGYGAIYQRKTKKGKIRWYLDYRDADRKRVQKVAPHASTKEEAALALKNEVEKAFDAEHGVTRRKHNLKLKDFVELFVENYSKPNKKSWKDDQYRLSRAVKILGADAYLTKISSLEIEKLKHAKLQEGASPSTVNTYLRVLKRMYNVAISWGYAQSNPVCKVRMYSEAEARRDKVLTPEEEARLFHVASKALRPILLVALHTGMRKGEILRLMWDDVNLETGIIVVRKSKSGKPRTIPINSFLLNEMLQLKSENRNTPYVFTSPKTSQPFKTIRKAFGDACQEAQILNFRFHDLRRTFGSRLALAGVDLNRIKELLGHASIKTTEIYLHADSSDIREAVEVLCPNHPGRLDNRDHLLRICDTAKSGTKSKPAIPFYSSN